METAEAGVTPPDPPQPPQRASTLSLLSEIECGTAADLFLAVQYETSPPGPTFLPPLDEILLGARSHPGGSSLQRGDLLEVVGPSGSGKTTFLIFLLMTHLLPRKIQLTANSSLPTTSSLAPPSLTVDIGGKQLAAAFLYPSTHSSPIHLLAKAMRGHVISCIEADTATQAYFMSEWRPGMSVTEASRVSRVRRDQVVEEIVRESLGRLRVVEVRPRWAGWVLALTRLLLPLHPGSRRNASTSRGSGGSPAAGYRGGHSQSETGASPDLVVCDGFADGFWPERWAEETGRSRGHGVTTAGNLGNSGSLATSRGKRPGLRGIEDVGMKDVMDVVGRIRKELGAVVVLSVQGLWIAKGRPFYTPHLPSPYPSLFVRDTHDPSHPSHAANTTHPPLPSTALTPSAWPLHAQITMRGRARPLQYPAETTLVDALRTQAGAEGGGARAMVGQTQRFEAVVRVPGGEGDVGGPNGAMFSFGIGYEGVVLDVPEVSW